MKKQFVILVLAVFLLAIVPLCSAELLTFDNKITYTDDDLKVTIDNLFGLGSELGIIELKSHTSVDEILIFGYGKEEVVMYYDFTDWELYEDGLGEIIFVDEKTGKEIEKDYYFVEWISKLVEVNDYKEICVLNKLNISSECSNEIIGTHLEEQWSWERLNTKDIPNRNTRIGLKTYIEKDDYIDGIWTIAGKEIDKHASWSSSLKTDLVAYYEMDETSGNLDDASGNGSTATAVGTCTYGEIGVINGSIKCIYDGDPSANKFDVTLAGMSVDTMSLSMWYKKNIAGDGFALMSNADTGTSNAGFNILFIEGSDLWATKVVDSGYTGGPTYVLASDDDWHHLVLTLDDPNIGLWIDNVNVANGTWDGRAINHGDFSILAGSGARTGTYTMDLIGIWNNKKLSPTEINELYNSDLGCNYDSCLAAAPVVTLNSPADSSSFAPGEEITFNATISLFTPINVSIYFNNTLNETNTSGILGDYIFTKSFPSEEYNWTIESCNIEGCNNDTRNFDINTIPSISVISPLNKTYNTSIFFNATSSIPSTSNWTINYNGTNLTLPNNNYLIDVEDGFFNLLFYGINNQTNEWGLNDSIYFSVDKTVPILQVDSPNETFNYIYPNYTLTINFTATDTNLDTCWYNYNTTDNTINCSTGILNSTTFNYQKDENNLTVYVNDTHGNQVSETVTWRYKLFENNRTLNTTSHQTQQETFQIDITANSSLTAVTLDYNGTEYSTTKSGELYSTILDIPSSNLGNNSIRWKFTYIGDTIYSDYSYQNISEAVFTICNVTYTDDFLNISFKDEDDLSVINASISTSRFIYYLGGGTETKLFTYQNNTDNYNYGFCATPDLTFNVDSYIQYKQGTEYPQRIYDPDVLQYTSTLTNKILYLLSNIDGLYVTFQIINSAEQGISDVEVTGTRIISGETVIIANGLTDASGSVTFWLNPDFEHIFNFVKTGYEDTTFVVTPTQSTYTITLSGGEVPETDCTRGVSYSISPSNNFLDQNTEYDFIFTIDSSYWALTNFSASIYHGNNTLIDSDSSTTQEGGTLTFNNINTTNQTQIYMSYSYGVNDSTCLSTSTNWIVQSIEGRDYSLWNLFIQADTYLETDLYGVKGDSGNSDFGRILIAFLIIVLVTGITIRQYGVQSESFIMSIVLSIVAILDVGLNFIPVIQMGDISVGRGLLTSIVFLVWLVFIIKER